jgi:DNA-binding HxlR family transcriptional regulator
MSKIYTFGGECADERESIMRHSEQLCLRYQQAMEILGKRWTGLILMVLLDRPLRFNAIAEQLEVVSDRMLSERLKELEIEGLIERRVYPETPVRIEYSLTEKGCALRPVIDAIGRWSHEWLETEPAVVS